MADYKNIQASLLKYCSEKATFLNTHFGGTFVATNLDAYLDENGLPTENIIGLESLTVAAANDAQPTVVFSAAITVATSADPNLMNLSDVIDGIFDDFKPTKEVRIFDVHTGLTVGHAITLDDTRVMPVQKSSKSKIFQSVVFEAALVY